jgi:hypothetical protein
MSDTTTSRAIAEAERLLQLDPPDWHSAFLAADAECLRLAEEEAARTGRSVEEVEADALAEVIGTCRELWAAEDSGVK